MRCLTSILSSPERWVSVTTWWLKGFQTLSSTISLWQPKSGKRRFLSTISVTTTCFTTPNPSTSTSLLIQWKLCHSLSNIFTITSSQSTRPSFRRLRSNQKLATWTILGGSSKSHRKSISPRLTTRVCTGRSTSWRRDSTTPNLPMTTCLQTTDMGSDQPTLLRRDSKTSKETRSRPLWAPSFPTLASRMALNRAKRTSA